MPGPSPSLPGGLRLRPPAGRSEDPAKVLLLASCYQEAGKVRAEVTSLQRNIRW
jgi:hypothetical protein